MTGRAAARGQRPLRLRTRSGRGGADHDPAQARPAGLGGRRRTLPGRPRGGPCERDPRCPGRRRAARTPCRTAPIAAGGAARRRGGRDPRPSDGADRQVAKGCDLRIDPSAAHFLAGEQGEPAVRMWVRPRPDDEADVDTAVLFALMAGDISAPVTMNRGMFGWAPTVQLTDVPAPAARPGMAAGDGASACAGQHVVRGGPRRARLHRARSSCRARQLAMIRRGRPPVVADNLRYRGGASWQASRHDENCGDRWRQDRRGADLRAAAQRAMRSKDLVVAEKYPRACGGTGCASTRIRVTDRIADAAEGADVMVDRRQAERRRRGADSAVVGGPRRRARADLVVSLAAGVPTARYENEASRRVPGGPGHAEYADAGRAGRQRYGAGPARSGRSTSNWCAESSARSARCRRCRNRRSMRSPRSPVRVRHTSSWWPRR